MDNKALVSLLMASGLVASTSPQGIEGVVGFWSNTTVGEEAYE